MKVTILRVLLWNNPWGYYITNLPSKVGDARDVCSIPRLGRSPEGGHGNPLQYSCLENPHGQRSLAGYIESTGLQRGRQD